MAFPTSIDSFTSPAATDYLNSPAHATQHSNVNTAINEIEKKLGITSSPASSASNGYILQADGSGNTTWVKKSPILTTDSDGVTITFDMDVSNLHVVTLGGNRILAVDNVAAGQCFVIRLIQDGTGSRTVTWFSGISWPDNVVPTLTTGVGQIDVFGFICTASNTYDGFIVGQNI